MSDALLTQNLLPLAFDAKSYNSGAITEAKIEITPQFSLIVLVNLLKISISIVGHFADF